MIEEGNSSRCRAILGASHRTTRLEEKRQGGIQAFTSPRDAVLDLWGFFKRTEFDARDTQLRHRPRNQGNTETSATRLTMVCWS